MEGRSVRIVVWDKESNGAGGIVRSVIEIVELRCHHKHRHSKRQWKRRLKAWWPGREIKTYIVRD